MRKLISFNTLALAIFAILLASCKSSTYADYTTYISADNDVYISVNSQELINKANFRKQLSSSEVAMMNAMVLGVVGQNAYDTIEPIMENPAECGIDLTKTIHFTIPQIEDFNNNTEFAIYATIKDINKFDSLIKTINEFGKDNVKNTELKEFKLTTLSEQNSLFILYNKTTLIITNTKNQLSTFIQPENSVAEEKDLAKALNSNYDIGLIYDKKSLERLSSPMIGDLLKSNLFSHYSGRLFEQATISFNNGSIDMVQKVVSTDKEVLEALDKINFTKKPKGSHSQFIKKDPLIYALIALNGKDVYDYINSSAFPLLEKFKLDDETMQIAQEISSSIDGDISLTISDIVLNFFTPKPELTLYIDTKDKELFNQINKLINDNIRAPNFYKKENENLAYFGSSKFSLYLGCTDDFIFLTTQKEVALAPEAKPEENLTKSRFYSNSKGKESVMVLDIDKIIKLPFVQLGINSIPQYKIPSVKEFIDNIDYAEFYSTRNEESTASLRFKQSKVNSLELITKLVIDLAKSNL